MSRILFAFWISVSLVLILGCGGEEYAPPPAARTQVAAAGAKEQKDEDTATRSKGRVTKEIWSYDPTGKRDPFEIPTMGEEGEINPATKYDLDQMWVDGIIWGAGNDVAHIILPNRVAIFVSVGDELGINHGRVKQIRGNQVVVEEIYVDPANPSEIHIIEKILELREGKQKKR